jgi:hypothetical protein
MKSIIQVDGKELKLNRFIEELSANLIDALARSLKFSDGRQIEFRLRGEEVNMFVDDREVSLNLGQARQIVGSVLNGFLRNLYGTENAQEIRLRCER